MINNSVCFFAPAKVNLILKVIGKRPDGYHEIFTIMQPVGLFDVIKMTLITDKKIVLGVIGENVPCGENNLVFQAAKLFFSNLNKPFGIKIQLIKHIPVGAGLGGGSSNAAITLLGLNTLFKYPFDLKDLLKMAAQLGSDVPFFIVGKPAIAQGRGEELQTLSFPLPLWYVIIFPAKIISTAWVYNQVRLTSKKFQTKIFSLKDIVEQLQNDLEIIVEEQVPEVQKAKRYLLMAGARQVLMSGSGSSVIAVFQNRKEAQKVKDALNLPKNWQSFLVKGL